ncbi:hypothetical protein [Pseudomonas sp. JG-B]|uniref:hypothetical protein n=1 Tax=Pseudomonas sp. JG-B TaxID=2603214 RepID=UPI00129E7A6A|nr:hypothetical protein [Pseudomonas sp. JG-B]MRK22944.1 hypothetical protein [Pseudomonas sp. JG-B]
MELKDFIANSLCEIAEGILDANERLKGTDAIISPAHFQAFSTGAQAYGRTLGNTESKSTRIVEKVDFDVAIAVEAGTSKNAGLKISIAAVGINTGGELKDKKGTASRIKFSIPMVFPSRRVEE